MALTRDQLIMAHTLVSNRATDIRNMLDSKEYAENQKQRRPVMAAQIRMDDVRYLRDIESVALAIDSILDSQSFVYSHPINFAHYISR